MVFTGIVEGTGTISNVVELDNLTQISIDMPSKFSNEIKIGQASVLMVFV